MDSPIFTPSDFVAVLNQTLENAYSSVILEGELANFKIAKGRWLYFDLKDEFASVSLFGSVYQLPGPLEDGIMLRVIATPKLHPRFGFTLNVQSMQATGEGSLKRASELLARKLKAEGLFDSERKRILPPQPQRIGLITAAKSAASADFLKILAERWGGVEVVVADVSVQGDQAPGQLITAIRHFNQQSNIVDVLVITRGGGNAEDLAAFNDERVVRAIAASRVPTLVAIGHEIDVSLAELAADRRASTPSNAAATLTPDRNHELAMLDKLKEVATRNLVGVYTQKILSINENRKQLSSSLESILLSESRRLDQTKRLLEALNPATALKRGYALIYSDDHAVRSASQVRVSDRLRLRLHDGTIGATVTETE